MTSIIPPRRWIGREQIACVPPRVRHQKMREPLTDLVQPKVQSLTTQSKVSFQAPQVLAPWLLGGCWNEASTVLIF
jgi:hypothetical protein